MNAYYKDLEEVLKGWTIVKIEQSDSVYYDTRFYLKTFWKTKVVDACSRDCGLELKEVT